MVPFHKVSVNKMKKTNTKNGTISYSECKQNEKKIIITLIAKEIGLPEKIVFIKKGKDNYYAID